MYAVDGRRCWGGSTAASSLRFAVEAGQAVLVGGEVRGEDFDGDFAAEGVSVAFQTTPMPPSPSFSVRR